MPLQSDIWALGVILITMMTTHLPPWTQASPKDKAFSHFLKNPRVLGRMFQGAREFRISESATTILQRIFRLDPLSRISLSELREEILKVDSFTRKTHESAPLKESPIRRFIPRIPRYRAPKRKGDIKQSTPAPSMSQPKATLVKNVPSLSAPGSSKSSGESSGPITPETHPAPDVGIADLDVEALDLNPKSSLQKSVIFPIVVSKPPRWSVFKETVERIQALPQRV
jgi:serine/threonine protein kinase